MLDLLRRGPAAALLATLFLGSLTLAGCDDNDGPAEQMGEQIDESMDQAADQMEEAADELEQAVDEQTN